ncbi:MAG: DUF1059 domain-containing protein [Proteobacteria bacterium]|nr:DUF1059 domain-containing protein [Pseudomonadota bacterium]
MARADTDAELLEKVAEHVALVHSMEELPENLRISALAAMCDESAY